MKLNLKREERDCELILRVREGDASACDTLLADYDGLICYIASKYYMRDGMGDVQDLAQEGRMGFLDAVKSYHPEKNKYFAAYAGLAVENRVKDAMRRCMNKTENLLTPVSINDAATTESRISPRFVSSDNPMTSYISEENVNAIMSKARKVLSPRQLEVFELRLAGFKPQEISLSLGLGPKAVDNALTTARSKLKKLVDDIL